MQVAAAPLPLLAIAAASHQGRGADQAATVLPPLLAAAAARVVAPPQPAAAAATPQARPARVVALPQPAAAVLCYTCLYSEKETQGPARLRPGKKGGREGRSRC